MVVRVIAKQHVKVLVKQVAAIVALVRAQEIAKEAASEVALVNADLVVRIDVKHLVITLVLIPVTHLAQDLHISYQHKFCL